MHIRIKCLNLHDMHSDMTEFIDTHSHLYDEAFTSEEDAAVTRSVDAGVTRIIFPDIDSHSREAMFT